METELEEPADKKPFLNLSAENSMWFSGCRPPGRLVLPGEGLHPLYPQSEPQPKQATFSLTKGSENHPTHPVSYYWHHPRAELLAGKTVAPSLPRRRHSIQMDGNGPARRASSQPLIQGNAGGP